MLYHLLYPLHKYISGFNVFRYITFRSGGAMLTALLLSILLGPLVIRKLEKRGVKGDTREELEGLYRLHQHKHKREIPTMGGLLILLTLIISTLLWARLDNRLVILTVISVASLGALGFIDDFIKLTKKRSLGLRKLPKLSGQLIVGTAIVLYLYFYPHSIDYRSQETHPIPSSFENRLEEIGGGRLAVGSGNSY